MHVASQKRCTQLLSQAQPLVIPWTVALQATPSMAFPLRGYWSGYPFLPPA